MDKQQGDALKRGLKNRHIQLIALGGAVGTGLFLGIANTIQIAGPAVLLGYAIGGFIAFLIMRQLSEMVVEEAVAGSFSHFACKYWSDFAGFVSGWNYWVLYVLVAMAELTAIGEYVHRWWPDFPAWVSVTICFILINLINFSNVKIYGELEFWLAIVKVIAVMSMIMFGCWLLLSQRDGSAASSVTNIWKIGGFFPHGIGGLTMAMAIIMFSFGGLELIGITAAEAENPRSTIPKATNQIIWRILLFYIGSITVLLSLYPWIKVVKGSSPFVMIFHDLGETRAADILNLVFITAALSVYNSCVYCNSRMLYGLALQKNGPRVLLNVDRRGVPYMALLLSSAATAICVLINYFLPGRAFELLMALVVSALVVNWAMISLTHLKFRRAKQLEGVTTYFKALWYPLGNWLCLLFLTGILVVMLRTPGQAISVWLIPLWLGVLSLGYWIKRRVKTDC